MARSSVDPTLTVMSAALEASGGSHEQWTSDSTGNLTQDVGAVVEPLSQSGGWRERDEVTGKDWEVCRPIFEKLYIEENRKLAEIMEIMRTVYGFTATYVPRDCSIVIQY